MYDSCYAKEEQKNSMVDKDLLEYLFLEMFVEFNSQWH